MVQGTCRHTDVTQSVIRGDGRHQCLGAVTAGHAEHIGASRDCCLCEGPEIPPFLQDDGLNSPAGGLGDQVMLLDLSTTGSRVHQEERVCRGRYLPPACSHRLADFVVERHRAEPTGQCDPDQGENENEDTESRGHHGTNRDADQGHREREREPSPVSVRENHPERRDSERHRGDRGDQVPEVPAGEDDEECQGCGKYGERPGRRETCTRRRRVSVTSHAADVRSWSHNSIPNSKCCRCANTSRVWSEGLPDIELHSMFDLRRRSVRQHLRARSRRSFVVTPGPLAWLW